MEEILKMVGNFGFPIVVSAYLLVRIEGKLNELSTSITNLAKAIAVLEVRKSPAETFAEAVYTKI
ncbi:YvrJ family protein [Desulfitobacterium sp.]|uniref:YvrJ family protein n=1 Tax=bioreactor metagenome TaxID=1076179 RepID=A0A645CCB0_9ZZZZ|nr:YvrJ family protein [Desulfitobacterium sp.]MEA4900369.1 YvrJ family protein [Desulfitobacterium sp.]